ncbi:MAG: SGNH/GDSL hydrolase family protein [Nitrospinae bacterium]|nr:SGNH/GDSL hydrolase family protein [Nitrospinota bacterium]
MRKFLGSAAAAIFSLAICLIALEGVARVYFSLKTDSRMEMNKFASIMDRQSSNQAMGHELAPGSSATLMKVPVSVNSHGFRDDEYGVEKPAGVYRIMLLGDSLTFGWGAKREERFSQLLEAGLNREMAPAGNARRAQVMNTGTVNYNTAQEAALYMERGRKFKPDMVILNYFINDAEEALAHKSPRLLSYSYFAMWLWGKLGMVRTALEGGGGDYKSYYRSLYSAGSPGWEAAMGAMAELGRQAKADGVVYVVAILPELHAVGRNYEFADIHEKVRNAAISGGADLVIDLAGQFAAEAPQSLWVAPDDAHPNKKGHEIIANAIMAKLTQAGLVNAMTDGPMAR